MNTVVNSSFHFDATLAVGALAALLFSAKFFAGVVKSGLFLCSAIFLTLAITATGAARMIEVFVHDAPGVFDLNQIANPSPSPASLFFAAHPVFVGLSVLFLLLSIIKTAKAPVED